MLEYVKRAIGLTEPDYDELIQDLIEEAVADLHIAGINPGDVTDNDPVVLTAIRLYCRMNFRTPQDYDRLKAAYETLKSQLQMSTGYTDWGDGA